MNVTVEIETRVFLENYWGCDKDVTLKLRNARSASRGLVTLEHQGHAITVWLSELQAALRLIEQSWSPEESL